MPKAVFLVYFSRERWWIDRDGRAWGPFATRAAAIVEAIPLAQAVQQAGRGAEVLAPGADGRHQVAWPPPAAHRASEAVLAG